MIQMIKLEDVTKQFKGTSIKAVDGVSVSIGKGEFVVLRGPSGSGKATFLNLIAGLITPESGSILIEGQAPKGRRQWAQVRAKKIGFIFQSFNLIPTLTALENVQVPMLGTIGGARKRMARARELLEQVGLHHRMSHRPCELSGGECQRVAIARGLANSPLIILADEPTGNLDSETSSAIMELIKSIHDSGDRTIVMATHEARFIPYATRVISYQDGRIIQDSTTNNSPMSGTL